MPFYARDLLKFCANWPCCLKSRHSVNAAAHPGHSFALALITACALAACNPALNWRSFSSSEGGFKAVFPGKPQTQTREVAWESTPMRLTMTAAGQGPTLFAVIVSERPRGQEQAVLRFFCDALLKNTGMALTPEATSQRVPSLAPAARAQAEFALSVRAARAVPADASRQPAQLAAQFLIVGERVVQIIALTGQDFPETELEAFFSAFELT